MAESHQVIPMECDNDSLIATACEDDSVISVSEKRKRPKVYKTWIKLRTFDNAELAEDFVKSEIIWAKKDTTNGKDGIKKYFRCNEVKKRGEQCKAELYLLYRSNSVKVDCYKTVNEHVHPDGCRKELTSEMKELIDKQHDLGVKPNRIRIELEKKNWKLKNMTILHNYLSRSKNNTGDSDGLMTVGELKQWCLDNSNIPENDNKPYVVDHDIKIVEEIIVHIRVVISTTKLLSRIAITDRLHADGTYKLNWEGLPTIVVGTTDCAKSFVPIAVSIVLAETREDYKFVFQSIANASNASNIR